MTELDQTVVTAPCMECGAPVTAPRRHSSRSIRTDEWMLHCERCSDLAERQWRAECASHDGDINSTFTGEGW